ncbi:sugar transferase [Clostridium saudiense]|mgnify:FL=1|uniref:Sugar transferase n=1 Tax=Clostridium saudiense TaxID=1414720 RepID=A0ABS2FCV7_9CLOT|nr:sugar transferase [Clostridium saudiense]MBM6818146.1 sugar transferase [Clostridium saudiense]
MKSIGLAIKRLCDIIVALGGIIILSPVLLVCMILIKCKLGSPIFFKQRRIGKNNKEFEMIKFRTMKDSVDKDGNLLPDEERMTKLGMTLRSLSLDELPELINILKGEMSLIGPRPLLVKYLPLYDDKQIKRHDVTPGLTGWAQVNGRNSLSWCEKFELDVWYVENWSLYLDVKIFFLTFYKVFKREGISQEGQATMEYFDGSN